MTARRPIVFSPIMHKSVVWAGSYDADVHDRREEGPRR